MLEWAYEAITSNQLNTMLNDGTFTARYMSFYLHGMRAGATAHFIKEVTIEAT